MLLSAGRYEDVDPGQEGGERPLPQEPHLHVYQEVFGLVDFSLQVDGACEAVQLAGAEVALFIALYDADDDVITRVGGGRSDPENLSWNDDVVLEAELIVGDPHGRVLTVQGVRRTTDPLAAPEKEPEGRREDKEECIWRRVVQPVTNALHIF